MIHKNNPVFDYNVVDKEQKGKSVKVAIWVTALVVAPLFLVLGIMIGSDLDCAKVNKSYTELQVDDILDKY